MFFLIFSHLDHGEWPDVPFFFLFMVIAATISLFSQIPPIHGPHFPYFPKESPFHDCFIVFFP